MYHEQATQLLLLLKALPSPLVVFYLSPFQFSMSPHKLLLVPSCWGLISLSNHHLWEGRNLLTALQQLSN